MKMPEKVDQRLGESVVDEVRAIREAIDQEVGHDVAKLAVEARRASDAVRREFGMKATQLPLSPAPTRAARTGE